jgi:hypothetical protein
MNREMTSRAVFTLFTLVLSVAAVAEQRGADLALPATGGADAHGYLQPGSWIVLETRTRCDGAAATGDRHRIAVVAKGTGGERAIVESQWRGDGFGPARPIVAANRQPFDDLVPKPNSAPPDRVVTVGTQRYVCGAATYEFRDATAGRTTTLTLWRDKSGGTQLPPRVLAIGGREIPLPGDALQAEIVVNGADASTKTQRQVVALASPLRVKGQTLSCLVERIETRGTLGGKAVAIASQEWYCHDLPGERLRVLTCGTVGGAEVRSETAVVDFHVVKAAAAATGATAGNAGGMPTILPSAE